MMSHILTKIIASQSVLDYAVTYFLDNPLEFVELAKFDHALAFTFAQAFQHTQIESMLRKCYGLFSNDKLLTKIVSIPIDQIVFKNDQVRSNECLFKIVAELSDKIYSPYLLDAEFKNENGMFDESKTNGLFPILLKSPSPSASRILANSLRLCSDNVVKAELVSIDKATAKSYLELIVRNYPVTKEAYNEALRCLDKIAKKSVTSFTNYLNKFNVDFLSILEQKQTDSEPNLADAFFAIGEKYLSKGEVNPMIQRYPDSSKRRSTKKPEPISSSSSASNQHTFFQKTEAPFPTTLDSAGYEAVILNNIATIEAMSRELEQQREELQRYKQ